jgi:hypothetical protein
MNLIRLVQLIPFLSATWAGAVLAEVLPPDWREIRLTPDNYEVTLASDAAFEGHYGASVRRTAPNVRPGDFGGFIQVALAAPWRGQRVAMRAWIKSEQADSGQMWLRIDSANDRLAMDNMDNRPVKGSTGWALYEIVMDVPMEAEYLFYGLLLGGSGRVDFDNVQFLPAPVGAKTTNQYKEGLMKLKHGQVYTPPSIVLAAPSNLDFESPPTP